jgi:dTDP-4-dehydrorhamnose 3,5-epimerase
METYHRDKYREGGVTCGFVQDNRSHSIQGVLRGLHYQLRRPQDKLVFAVRGEIFDVAVDIRRESPTFGRWFGTRLSAENHRQLFIPRGFAHGFCVLSRRADVIYKCSNRYAPGDEYGIHWADPEIGIAWPIQSPLLSEKDADLPLLAQIPASHLPQYG